MFGVGSHKSSCVKGWECHVFLSWLPCELRAGPEWSQQRLRADVSVSRSVLSSRRSHRCAPISACMLLPLLECNNKALQNTQAAKNNSNKNKDVIKARYDWSEVTASVTWLSQIPRTVGDRKGRREENLYLFKVLGPKLLTSRLW